MLWILNLKTMSLRVFKTTPKTKGLLALGLQNAGTKMYLWARLYYFGEKKFSLVFDGI